MKKISVISRERRQSFLVHEFTGDTIDSDSCVLLSYAGKTAGKENRDILQKVICEKLKWLIPGFTEKTISVNAGKFKKFWSSAQNRLWVVIGDGVSKQIDVNFHDTAGIKVYPVFQRGTNFNLDNGLAIINAGWWNQTIAETVPVIFGLMKLMPDELRVFISYRRKDTEGIARQLYDALQHTGIDVFLDSYSVPPAIDFQKRLAQQLADKGVAVILESPELSTSEWVRYELDFIRVHRLGYCALNIGGDKAPKLAQVDDENRMVLKDKDLAGKNKPLKEKALSKKSLAKVIDFIREKHAVGLFNKQNYLKRSLVDLLDEKKAIDPLTYSFVDNGFMEITKGSNRQIVGLNVRPSELKNFYEIDRSKSTGYTHGIIVGPPFHENERKLHNDWLSGKSQIAFYDEGNLNDFVNSL